MFIDIFRCLFIISTTIGLVHQISGLGATWREHVFLRKVNWVEFKLRAKPQAPSLHSAVSLTAKIRQRGCIVSAITGLGLAVMKLIGSLL